MENGDSASEFSEYPVDEWEVAYMAATTDWRQPIRVRVKKNQSGRFGFRIAVELSFRIPAMRPAGFVDDFLDRMEMKHRTNPGDDFYRVIISSREDIARFLSVVEPYLMNETHKAAVLANELIPILDEGLDTKEKFVEAVEICDKIRGDNTKYTAEYFKDEWSM